MNFIAMAAVSLFALGAEASDCASKALDAATAAGYSNLTLTHTDKHKSNEGHVRSYMFWFRQAGEQGYVVVNADQWCTPFQVYTRYR